MISMGYILIPKLVTVLLLESLGVMPPSCKEMWEANSSECLMGVTAIEQDTVHSPFEIDFPIF